MIDNVLREFVSSSGEAPFIEASSLLIDCPDLIDLETAGGASSLANSLSE